jgi:cytochrome d ubiquinol oxidase subunit I
LLAGWVTTEAGRQPWVVYGVLRTAQAVSPVTEQQVGITLMMFVIVYCVVFGTGIYYILKLLRQGPPPFDTAPAAPKGSTPDTPESAEKANQSGRRPLAAAD